MSLGQIKRNLPSSLALVLGATALATVSATIFLDTLKTFEKQSKTTISSQWSDTISNLSVEKAASPDSAAKRLEEEKTISTSLAAPATMAPKATEVSTPKTEKPMVARPKPRARIAKRSLETAPAELVAEFEEALDFQAITESLRQNFYVAVTQQWERKLVQQKTTIHPVSASAEVSEYSEDDVAAVAVDEVPEIQSPQPPEPEQSGPKALLMAALPNDHAERHLKDSAEAKVLVQAPIQIQSAPKPDQVTDQLKDQSAVAIQWDTPPSVNTQNLAHQPVDRAQTETSQKVEDYPLSLPPEVKPKAEVNSSAIGAGMQIRQPKVAQNEVQPKLNTQSQSTQNVLSVSRKDLNENRKSTQKTTQPQEQSKSSIPSVTIHNDPSINPVPPAPVPPAPPSPVERVQHCRQSETPVYSSFSNDSSNAADQKIPLLSLTELTREDPAGHCPADTFYGWLVAKAPLYWNTIFWSNQRAEAMTHNQALLLAATAHTQIQSGTALVYGRVPSGYRVALSGRSESPVYMNEKSEAVAETEDSADRYYAFVNVAPGSQLLYFIENKLGQTGAVGIPAVGDAATYVDLRQLNPVTPRGEVLDASSAQDQRIPMAKALVELIGYEGVSTFTKDDGSFAFSEVLGISDIPMFIQVTVRDRLSHRYRWSTLGPDYSPLFVFSNDQVRNYSDQLDGGISLDSGMMLGAVPSVIRRAPEGELLYPGLRKLAADDSLGSEVYTLNPKSELQVAKGLSIAETRILYFQLSEGPAIPLLENKEQKIIWSEMQFISKNVVNVIGPY